MPRHAYPIDIRKSVYNPRGRGFESRRARHSLTKLGTSPRFPFLHGADGVRDASVTAADGQLVPVDLDFARHIGKDSGVHAAPTRDKLTDQ
jgi:hypothetical protein